MDKNNIIFTERARNDISDIAKYHLQKVGAQSAARVTDLILDDISQLETQPLMGPLHSDPVLAKHQYRKLVCGKYICIYRADGNSVYIYRIVHGSTNYPKWIL